MFKIFGEYYYLDLDRLEDYTAFHNSSGETENQIHVVKYETIKFMIEIVMEHIEEVDETLGHSSTDLTLPFKMAFNTLLTKNIINKL